MTEDYIEDNISGTISPSLRNFHPESDNFQFILYQISVPILFGLISLAGLVGNSLVIYVIISQSRMRTVTNLLLLNLALADLAFVLVIPPFTAYEFATAGWPFGLQLCRIMHYLVNVTAYVTVYTIVLIAVTRYLSAVRGPETAWLRTPLKTAAVLVALWILVLLLNIPIYFSYNIIYYNWAATDSQLDIHQYPDCDVTSITHGRFIYSTFFIFGYLLPLISVALLYIAILYHVSWTRSLRRPVPTQAGVNQPQHTTAEVEALDGHSHGHTVRRQRQLGRLLMCVVVLFAVLWLPIHIHLLAAYFGHVPDNRAYEAVSMLWNALAYINSCVNPVIYNCTSKEFRRAYRRLLSRTTDGLEYPADDDEGEQANDVETEAGCCGGGRKAKPRSGRARRDPQLTYSTTYEKVHLPTVPGVVDTDVLPDHLVLEGCV